MVLNGARHIHSRQALRYRTLFLFSVRKDAGHSLCSSITQSLTYDTRDDIVLPTAGLVVRLSQQLAGFGGNVSFLKTEADAGITHSLQNRIVILFKVVCDWLGACRPACSAKRYVSAAHQ